MANSKLQEKDIENELVYSDDASESSNSDGDNTNNSERKKKLILGRSKRTSTETSLHKKRLYSGENSERNPRQKLLPRSPQKTAVGCADQTLKNITKRSKSETSTIKSSKVTTNSVKHKCSHNKHLKSVWNEIEPIQASTLNENNKKSNEDSNCCINSNDPKKSSISQLKYKNILNKNHSLRNEEKSGLINAMDDVKIYDSPKRKNKLKKHPVSNLICNDLFGKGAKSPDKSEQHDNNSSNIIDVFGKPCKSSDIFQNDIIVHTLKSSRQPNLHQCSDSDEFDNFELSSLAEKRIQILNKIFPENSKDFVNLKNNDDEQTDSLRTKLDFNKLKKKSSSNAFEGMVLKKTNSLICGLSNSTKDGTELQGNIASKIYKNKKKEDNFFCFEHDKGMSFSKTPTKKLKSNLVEIERNQSTKKIEDLVNSKIYNDREMDGIVVEGSNKMNDIPSVLYKKTNILTSSDSDDSKNTSLGIKHKAIYNSIFTEKSRGSVLSEDDDEQANSFCSCENKSLCSKRKHVNKFSKQISSNKCDSKGNVNPKKSSFRCGTISVPVKGASKICKNTKEEDECLSFECVKDIKSSKTQKKEINVNLVWSEKKYSVPKVKKQKMRTISPQKKTEDLVDSKFNYEKETDSFKVDSPLKCGYLVLSEVDDEQADSFSSCDNKSKCSKRKNLKKLRKNTSFETCKNEVKDEPKKNSLRCSAISNSVKGYLTKNNPKFCKNTKEDESSTKKNYKPSVMYKKNNILTSSDSDDSRSGCSTDKHKLIYNSIFTEKSRGSVPSEDDDEQANSFCSSENKSLCSKTKHVKKFSKQISSNKCDNKGNVNTKNSSFRSGAISVPVKGASKICKNTKEEDECLSFECVKDIKSSKTPKKEINVNLVWSEKKYSVPKVKKQKMKTISPQKKTDDLVDSKFNYEKETNSFKVDSPLKCGDLVPSEVDDEQADSFSSCDNKSKCSEGKHLKKLRKNTSFKTCKNEVKDEQKNNSLRCSAISNSVKGDLTKNNEPKFSKNTKEDESSTKKNYKPSVMYKKNNILTSSDSDDSRSGCSTDKHKLIYNSIFTEKSRSSVLSEDDDEQANSFCSSENKSLCSKRKHVNQFSKQISSNKCDNKGNVKPKNSGFRSGTISVPVKGASKICKNTKEEDECLSFECVKDIKSSKTQKKEINVNLVWSEKKYSVTKDKKQKMRIISPQKETEDLVDSKINHKKETDSFKVDGSYIMTNKLHVASRKNNLLSSSDSEDLSNDFSADKRIQNLNSISPHKCGDLVLSEINDELVDSCSTSSKNKFVKKENGLSNSTTVGIELQKNNTSKCDSNMKNEENRISFVSDKYSKLKKEESKNNSLWSEKTNSIHKLKETSVLHIECYVSRKRKADNNDPGVKPSKVPCKSPLKSINSISQSSSITSSHSKNSESPCENTSKFTPIHGCSESDYTNSKAFSAKKNLFSPQKASDLPQPSIDIKRCSTIDSEETRQVHKQNNCGERQDIYASKVKTLNNGVRNEKIKSYNTSSDELNKTPTKSRIKDQEYYEIETSFMNANKTPLKNRSNISDVPDFVPKDKIKTGNILNSPSDSKVNKLSSSIECTYSTPTKNTPSKLDRALKQLNIDMVDQSIKSPVRQVKKRKPGVASSNLQRDKDKISESEELRQDSDSDSYSAMSFEETTISPPKLSQYSTFAEDKLSKSKCSLSKCEFKRLQIDMNDSLKKSPLHNGSDVQSPIGQYTSRSRRTSIKSHQFGSNSDKKTENSINNHKEAQNDKCNGSPFKNHFTPGKKDKLISSGKCYTPRSSSKYSKISDHAQEVSSPQPKQQALVTTPVSKKSTGRGFLTPSMARKEREQVGKLENDLDTTRRQLHISTVPKSLPCRDTEFSQIKSFLLRKIEHSSGGCMYISGVPGTGKTATVHAVIRSLQEEADKGDVPEFDFVEVNGLRLTEPKQAYVRIHQALTNQKLVPDQAQQLLNKRFSSSCKRSTIILVDELDYLCNRRQDVVYNILDWPSKNSSRLVVLAISNTMDLPERTLKGRVTSRMGLTRLAFQPYSHHQLREIVCDRLSGTATFHPDAVQLVARKVAAVSGDARRALDICRRTTELVVGKGGGQVTASHVEQALTQIFSGPRVLVIQSLGRLAQLVLRALRDVNERTGVDETTAGQVYQHLEQICALDGCPIPTVGSVLQTCVSLVGLGLMVAEKGRLDVRRKMSLNVSSDDIHYALETIKSL